MFAMFDQIEARRALETHGVDLEDQEIVMDLLEHFSSCRTHLYQKDIALLAHLVAMVCGQKTMTQIKETASTQQCSRRRVVLSLVPSGELFFDRLRKLIEKITDDTFRRINKSEKYCSYVPKSCRSDDATNASASHCWKVMITLFVIVTILCLPWESTLSHSPFAHNDRNGTIGAIWPGADDPLLGSSSGGSGSSEQRTSVNDNAHFSSSVRGNGGKPQRVNPASVAPILLWRSLAGKEAREEELELKVAELMSAARLAERGAQLIALEEGASSASTRVWEEVGALRAKESEAMERNAALMDKPKTAEVQDDKGSLCLPWESVLLPPFFAYSNSNGTIRAETDYPLLCSSPWGGGSSEKRTSTNYISHPSSSVRANGGAPKTSARPKKKPRRVNSASAAPSLSSDSDSSLLLDESSRRLQDEMRAKDDEYKETLTGLNLRIEELEDDLFKSRNNIRYNADSSPGEREKLRARVSDLEGEIGDLSSRNRRLEQDLIEEKRLVVRSTEEAARVMKQLQRIRSSKSEEREQLLGRIAELEGQIARLESRAAAGGGGGGAGASALVERRHEEEVGCMSEQIFELERELSRREERSRESDEEEARSLRRESGRLAERVAELESEASERDRLLETSRKASDILLDNMEEQKRDYERELDRTNALVRELKTAIGGREEEMAALRERFDSLEVMADELRSRDEIRRDSEAAAAELLEAERAARAAAVEEAERLADEVRRMQMQQQSGGAAQQPQQQQQGPTTLDGVLTMNVQATDVAEVEVAIANTTQLPASDEALAALLAKPLLSSFDDLIHGSADDVWWTFVTVLFGILIFFIFYIQRGRLLTQAKEELLRLREQLEEQEREARADRLELHGALLDHLHLLDEVVDQP